MNNCIFETADALAKAIGDHLGLTAETHPDPDWPGDVRACLHSTPGVELLSARLRNVDDGGGWWIKEYVWCDVEIPKDAPGDAEPFTDPLSP